MTRFLTFSTFFLCLGFQTQASEDNLYCSMSPEATLSQGFASLTQTPHGVRVTTAKGDNLGIHSQRCDSGVIDATVSQASSGETILFSKDELSIHRMDFVGLQGRIESALISGSFRDKKTGKKCTINGRFKCHSN